VLNPFRSVDDIRPPIPLSCARRPVVGGLPAPFVNARLADGGVDFRTPHTARYEECLRRGLCQTCGGPLGPRAVIFGGPNQLRSRQFDEPPLCPPCAVYASRACPMVAGRAERYAASPPVSDGKRGHACALESGCDCGGWVPTDPSDRDRGGEPAHAFYALYTRTGAWQLTGSYIACNCGDKACKSKRFALNGTLLTAPPRKVVLVSAPGEGRTWRTLSAGEVAALMPEPEKIGGIS
jgi:hypothetical protein